MFTSLCVLQTHALYYDSPLLLSYSLGCAYLKLHVLYYDSTLAVIMFASQCVLQTHVV